MAARMLWQKGVREFVAAAEICRERFPTACFQLAGESDTGHADAVPQAWLHSQSKRGIVEYLGHLPHLESFFNHVHVFVLPSYYGEGVPRVLLEAAASRLPIVAADSPGCREVIVDGETGLIARPRDAHSLADRILELLTNPGLRDRLAKAAFERVVAEFDVGSVTRKYLQAYKEVGVDVRGNR